jgi:hypothetical protein
MHVKADSLLLVEQMRGNYRVKNAGLIPLYQRARGLVLASDTSPSSTSRAS